MSTKKRDYIGRHVPTLNRYLLEGAFSQAMHQVLMSLDQCRAHEETPKMSLEDHVRALWVISREEAGTALMLVDGRHEETLVKKQRYWVKRTKTLMRRLDEFDSSDATEESLKMVLNSVVSWIQDAHLILHEDTPSKTREYLSSKGMSDGEIESEESSGSTPRAVADIH